MSSIGTEFNGDDGRLKNLNSQKLCLMLNKLNNFPIELILNAYKIKSPDMFTYIMSCPLNTL